MPEKARSTLVVLALDLFRLFAAVTILSFASYTDWQWRRAPNLLWIILALAGVVALAAQAALDPAGFIADWQHLAFIPAFAVIVYGLWYFGLIAGGADAKALMALGVLLPYPVHLGEVLPFYPHAVAGWPLAVSVLSNALLLFMAIPVAFVIWNVVHGSFRVPHLFLGIRREGREVRRGHVWPMETIDEEGRRKTRYFPSRMSAQDLDLLFERVQALGSEKVWVTPKIPFMLPLLAGLVTAFVVGDLLLMLMTRLLPVG